MTNMTDIETASAVLASTKDEVLPKALAVMPDTVELHWVDYRDALSPEQVKILLAGGAICDDARFDEWLSEDEWYNLNEYLKQIAVDAELDSWQMATIEDELIDELRDRDRSDPVTEMLAHVPSRWMRYWIDERDLDSDELIDRLWDPGVPSVAAVLDALGLLGTDQHTPELEDEIANVLANSGTDMAIYLLWHDDVDAYVEAAGRDYEGGPVQTITWKDPYLLLFHPFSGRGWADRIHCTVTTQFSKERISLDERGCCRGYSFTDETCGGWVNDNDTTVTIAREEP